MKEPNIDELRWARIYDPNHIPKYLVEQVKQRDYTVEDFYIYQALNLLIDTPEGKQLNPLFHLHVLADTENLVKGFVWFEINALTKSMFIHTYSVDKDYWNKGIAVKKLVDYLKEIRKGAKLNRVYWITTYPAHSEKNGFRKSSGILMEYSEDSDGRIGNGGVKLQGKRQSTDSGADKVSIDNSGAECGPSGSSVPELSKAV